MNRTWPRVVIRLEACFRIRFMSIGPYTRGRGNGLFGQKNTTF